MTDPFDDYRRKVAGKPYRPANGTEGMIFDEHWCDSCTRDAKFRAGGFEVAEDGCKILANTFVFDIDDPEYPTEWVHDADGHPTCTAFERSDPE